MRKLIQIFLLGAFSLFYAQKQKKCMKNSSEIIFSTEKFLFYADPNGGTETRGFSILENQEELNNSLSSNKFLLSEENKIERNKINYPKNQTVIVYNFGESRSGIHKIEGIDKLRLINDTLEVFLTKKEINLSEINLGQEVTVQVITYPRIFFSIPKNHTFKHIIIK